MVPTPPSPLTSGPRRRATHAPLPLSDVTAAFTSVFAAVAIALAATYAVVPDLRSWLSGRGGLLDWLTLASLISAATVGVWAVRRSSSESLFPLVTPAIAVWGILDELRYLTGLVGSPSFHLGEVPVRSYDDLAAVVASWASQAGLDWRHGLIVLAAIGTITALALVRSQRWAEGRVLVTEHRVVTFIVLSVATTAATPAIGLFGGGTTAVFAAGLLEMIGATLLVVAGLAAADHRRTVAGWRRRLMPWLAEEGSLSSLGDRV